jgi:peptidoglycan/xylan/chitin deacetylase (PgdA/CDA1 family)
LLYCNKVVIPATAGIQYFQGFSKMDTRQNNSGMTEPLYFEQKLNSFNDISPGKEFIHFMMYRCALVSFFTTALLFISCINGARPLLPFANPIVAVTFDDADRSVYTLAFPAMRSMDSAWTATHFFPVTYPGAPGVVTVEEEKEMEKAGWETGGHGVTHENLSSIPPDSAECQVRKSHEFLAENGLCHASFAYPFGNYNDAVKAITRSWFENIRTTHDYEYPDGVDRKELGYYAVKEGCTADDIIGRVEKAKGLGSPLVVIGFHVILPDSAAPVWGYWCREKVFMEFLRYLKKEEYPVFSLQKAMDILGE